MCQVTALSNWICKDKVGTHSLIEKSRQNSADLNE